MGNNDRQPGDARLVPNQLLFDLTREFVQRDWIGAFHWSRKHLWPVTHMARLLSEQYVYGYVHMLSTRRLELGNVLDDAHSNDHRAPILQSDRPVDSERWQLRWGLHSDNYDDISKRGINVYFLHQCDIAITT